MLGFVLLLTAGQGAKPTLSEVVAVGMRHVSYRLVSTPSRTIRPKFSANERMEGASYFAVAGPDGHTGIFGAVKGHTVYLDLNGDGKFAGQDEVKEVAVSPAPWDHGQSGSVTFNGCFPGISNEVIQLIWHRNDAIPTLNFGTTGKGMERFSRYILCQPQPDPSQAPVFNLSDNLSFAPDCINLSINLSGSLYSPGGATDVEMEIGTAGAGANSFLGRTTSDIPSAAYVEASYSFKNAKTGKLLSYVATLRGRC